MKIIETAAKYIGQREQIGNVFDMNTPLGKLVKESGQNNGEAWCAYFAEGVCVQAYPEKRDILRKLFSASAVKTVENFRFSGYVVGQWPILGSIVVWRRHKEGQPTWQGHIGIVSKVIDNNNFEAIEGNTNSAGSREGDSVQIKRRDMLPRDNGLNVIGFIRLDFE